MGKYSEEPKTRADVRVVKLVPCACSWKVPG